MPYLHIRLPLQGTCKLVFEKRAVFCAYKSVFLRTLFKSAASHYYFGKTKKI